jgi:hypothetical protein
MDACSCRGRLIAIVICGNHFSDPKGPTAAMSQSRVQFGILTILLAMSGVGAAVRVWVLTPSPFACLLALTLAMCAAALVVAGVIYGRGNVRAFSLGAAIPLTLLLISHLSLMRMIPTNATELQRLTDRYVLDPFGPAFSNDHRRVIIMMAAGILTGALTVGTKWLLSNEGGR